MNASAALVKIVVNVVTLILTHGTQMEPQIICSPKDGACWEETQVAGPDVSCKAFTFNDDTFTLCFHARTPGLKEQL